MPSKSAILSLLLLLFCSCLYPQSTAGKKPAVFKGKMMNFPKNWFQLQDYSELGYLNEESVDFTLNSDSTFRIQIELKQPTYFRLYRNRLYFSPGDSVEAQLFSDGKSSVFTGRGAEVNNYLKSTPNYKSGSYVSTIGHRKLSPDYADADVFMKKVLELGEQRKALLREMPPRKDAFVDSEHARIEADIVNSMLSFPGYYARNIKLKLDEEASGKYLDSLLTLFEPTVLAHLKKINQEKYLSVEGVRNLMPTIQYYQKEAGKFEMNLDEGIDSYIKTVDFISNLESFGLTQEIIDQQSQLMVDSELLPRHKRVLAHKLEPYERLRKGNPAFDLTLNTVEGELKPLSDFKGSVIVLDFWATWCGPCIQEFPHFEELQEKFPEVTFLSITIDDRLEKWKKYLVDHEKEGPHQYQILRKDLAEYKVFSIPRFFVIDRDFNIVNVFAPRPSSGDLEELIESLP